MCQVADGCLVGCSLILDNELIVVGKCVSYPNCQLTSEAFFTIRARVFQYDSAITHAGCIPNFGVETCRSTMQVVVTIVACQLILLAVKYELAFFNTVAITTDEHTQEWLWRVDDVLYVVVSLG